MTRLVASLQPSTARIVTGTLLPGDRDEAKASRPPATGVSPSAGPRPCSSPSPNRGENSAGRARPPPRPLSIDTVREPSAP